MSTRKTCWELLDSQGRLARSGDADGCLETAGKRLILDLIQDSDKFDRTGSREGGPRGLWIWEVLGCGSLPRVSQCTHHNINLNHSCCPWVAPVPLRGPAFIAKESVQMYTATLGLCNPQHTIHKPGRNSAARPGASQWSFLEESWARGGGGESSPASQVISP